MTTTIRSLKVSLLAAAFLAPSVSAQNVGIGTTTPKSKLSVNGSTASGGIAVGDAAYTSTTGTVAPLNGAIIQGRTGIGTPAPSQCCTCWMGTSFVRTATAMPPLYYHRRCHQNLPQWPGQERAVDERAH